MARPPCRFHLSPGGCRNGDNCQFVHSNPSSRPLVQSSTSSPAPVPPGVCNYYWKRGDCKREFECRYKHVDSPMVRRDSLSAVPSTNLFKSHAAKELAAPFLTEKGLAKISGNATDGFFSGNNSSALSPTDAHSRLKRFLADNYKFKNSLDIYAFLSLLCCANTSNTLWVRYLPNIPQLVILRFC